MINRRNFMIGSAIATASAGLPKLALAAGDSVRIGLVAPMTGPFTITGAMMEAGMRLYMAQNGDTVAGRKIELIVRDDTGVPDVTKRLAQELVANDGVHVLAGFGLTPLALAVAPLSAQAKIPQVVMMAAASVITKKSPFIVRTSCTQAQTTVPLAPWCKANGINKVMTLVADYAPGIETETAFVSSFREAGGTIVASVRVPLSGNDFSPFLQHAAEARPDALFMFVPTGLGATLIKQFVERGLDKQGIRLIGEGSVTEDSVITQMDDSVLGMVTSHNYSAAHDSPENRAFVAAFKAANKGMRPNQVAVHAYDGTRVIYEALKKTAGSTEGTALVEAMKGQSFVSPRGPVTIDPETREPVQNIYIRKVEKVGGELYNVEFQTVADVKAPKGL